jgi:Ankyrin repeats (3 copies)/MYND finger
LLALPGAAGDVHTRSVKQQTPLHMAAKYAADSVVQLLLERGADADVRDCNGNTPLMMAQSLAVVKLLLAAGADAIAANNIGDTALHRQAYRGACAGTVCLLLKAGADPTVAVSFGGAVLTAAGVAARFKHCTVEALLLRAENDYRRKHPFVFSAVRGSSSGDINRTTGRSRGSTSSSSIRASATEIGDSGLAAAKSAAAASSGCSAAAVADVIDGKESAVTASTDDAAKFSVRSVDTDEVATLNTATADMSLKRDAPTSTVTQQQQQQQQHCKVRKTKQPCANCSKPTTKRCRRCETVYYCSVECQKVCFKDAQHRAQCEAKAAEIV